MALAKQDEGTKKKTNTQTVTIGGRTVNVPASSNTTSTTTPKPSNTSNVTVGGRVLSQSQKNDKTVPNTIKNTAKSVANNVVNNAKAKVQQEQTSFINNNKQYQQQAQDLSRRETEQNNPQSRLDFNSDRDYEEYIVNNKIDYTKGDARDYLQQKAAENGTTSMNYMQGMRTRNKNAADTAKVREKVESGEVSEETIQDINKRYGVLLDENGNEADFAKYQNDIDLVNKTAEDINKKIEKLNNDYTNGKIDYNTMQAEYNRLVSMWDENAATGDRLKNYKTLQGFAYYDWAKDNGRDVTDFEAYVENVNDLWPERLAQEYAASWVDTANILPETIDVLAQIFDENYDSSNSAVGKLSESFKQTSQELREYAFAGASPTSQWSLQCIGSLMPMINSMMIGSLMPIGNVETFTNVSLGLQSGAETTRQRLEEGVSPELALMNGILHGTITGLVEGLNAGAITELFTGAPLAYLTKVGMAQFAGPAVLKQVVSAAISEGAEETIETLADAMADNLQNFIYGGITGERLKATELNAGEMINEFIMAAVGTVVLGAPNGIATAVTSKQRYNAAMGAKAHFMSVLESPVAMEEEIELARKGIEVINDITKPFEDQSQTASAVTLSSDMVAPPVTFNEMMNNLTNAINSDVVVELERAQQTLKQAQNLESNLQNALLERNVFMPASDYMTLGQNKRVEFLNLAKELNESGREAWFVNLGDGVNGYNSGKRTIINPYQTNSIDVDLLADLDEKEFQDILKGNDQDRIFQDAGASASATAATAHELTHFAEMSENWGKLRDYVRQRMGAKRFFLLEKRLGDIYRSRGVRDFNAEHEAVAYYIQKNMGNLDFLSRLAGYNSSFFNRLSEKARAYFSGDVAARMEETFMSALYDAQSKLETAGTPAYSIGSTFQAINLTIEKNGNVIEAYAGNEKIKEITVGHIRNSSLGNLLQLAVNPGNGRPAFLTSEEAERQMKMYADMCNTILKTQDLDLLWAISGSIGYNRAKDGAIDETESTKSSAFTSNADKQYNRTFDVTTICNKTQQIINVMSDIMVKLDRGLTEQEIVKIVYDETNKAGEPVPCPVCYVFSRWVGVGGLLNNIKNYQEEYANVDVNDLRKRYNALSKQVDDIVKRENINIDNEIDEDTDEKTKKKIKGTKAREILDKRLTAEYNSLLSKQNIFKMTGKELSSADKKRLSDLEQDMAIMDRWSWIGKVRLSPNYEPVPSNVLFDMNKGEEFANDYPETWSYRTTRGPAMGKAITPYTSEVLGQTIMGFSGSPSNMKKLGGRRSAKNNPFLKENITKPLINYFNKAVANAKAQNLIGGSRAQSTSDFRYEYVLDYMLHFMELQAIGSYGQTYTKVPEAVSLLASVGYEVNMSLMAKGFGYKEVSKGTENAIELDGKWYVLDFSNKTGMNAEDAFRLSGLYDNAQPIIVGINDIHMRLCMADPRITFIIPYHASGASEQRYLDLMEAVGETVEENARKDYSKVQNDTEIEKPTTQQKKLRKARLDIIMGKATAETREIVKDHEILRNLYSRFYEKGVDDECYHNFLKKDQAKQIFPYEYWDKTTTIETADENGTRFVDYCRSLGMVPRFEEFCEESGYWKTLIDRPMYDLDGNYRSQQAINMNNFNSDFLFRNKMLKGIVQPSQQFSRYLLDNNGNYVLDENGNRIETVPYIAGRSIDRINNGQYSLGYGYHYGAEKLDPNKKSERLSSRSGRGTGAFGTGTYFFGDGRFKSSYMTDKGKTEHKVDFSDYNLFRPKTTEEGWRLHRLFKELDDNYSQTGPKSKTELKQRVSEIINELNEIEPNLDEEAVLTPEDEERIKNILVELGDSEKFVDDMFNENRDDKDSPVAAWYLADDLQRRYIDEDEWSSRRQPRSLDYAEDYENMESHIPELAQILGEDEDYMYDVVNEAIRSAEADTYKRDFWDGYYDSVGTRVMKKLGYEGIDVRNMEGLDNSTYGSVIYDLKPETIQYSLGARKGLENIRRYAETNPDATFTNPNGGQIKYSDFYENMEKRLTRATQMFGETDKDGNRVFTNDDIYQKTGWMLDPNDPDTLKVEFYDDGSVEKIAKYVQSVKGIGTNFRQVDAIRNQPTFGDILGDDSLFMIMYPELKNVHIMVTSRAPRKDGNLTYGWYWDPYGNKSIESILIAKRKYANSNDFNVNELANTIGHEVQHFIQNNEGFNRSPKGTPYRDQIEEKEAFKVGDMQSDTALRGVDEYGNMYVDDEINNTGVYSDADEGDVNDDESTNGVDDSGEDGELEDGDGLPGEGDITEGSGEDDSDGLTPDDIGDNLTDNIDDDGEGKEPADILRGGPEVKKTTWKDVIRKIRHRIIDHLDAVEDLARKTKNKKIIAKADTAMNFRAIANNVILEGRYELLKRNGTKIGDSLESILGMIPKDSVEDFDYYMYNYRNMDSTSLRERLGLEYIAEKYLEDHPMMDGDGNRITAEMLAATIENMENNLSPEDLAKNPLYREFTKIAAPKYVFGTSSIGYEESRQIVEEMEEKHPEFKAIAEKLWEYGRQDLKVLQDAGVISQDAYDMFLRETPHYVPIARNIDKGKFEGKYKLDPNKAIRRFKGSNKDMWSLEYALINHTYNVYRTALTNNLHQEIYNTLKPKKSNAAKENIEDIVQDKHEVVEKMKDGTFRMYAYVNGTRRMVKIDENLYNSLSPRVMGMTIPGISTLSEIRRNLITSWNPIFYATNAVKDINDALYNTKYVWRFVPNYVRAWNDIKKNGEFKQLYLRNGGAENSYLHEVSKKDVKWNPLRKLIAIGDAVELAPRLAEFISSIEAGNTIEEAMLDAAEITTNFKRGGDIAKTINRNGVTFFNASVQGFEKQVRNWKDAKQGGAKGMLTYMARLAFISGIPLFLMNGLMWDDDDDYKELSDYIKENYYIIGKIGNRFIRIPKGRVAAFYQTVMTASDKTLKGEVDLWNAIMDVIQSGVDNVAPNNPTENFLGAPLIQAFSTREGKTWYGDDLVPSRLQKYPDAEQYDYSTDILSIFLGKQLNVSPYKINYILDQYSGGIGDIGLPMMTLQANNGIDSKFWASALSPILDKFTTDPVMKKQCVSSFYEMKDKLEIQHNSKNATDEEKLAYKYLTAVSNEMSDLYSQIRDVQGSNMGNSEKYAMVRELKDKINKAAQQGLASYDDININGSYATAGGVVYQRDKDGEWRKMRGETLKKMDAFGLSNEQRGQFYDNYYNIENARQVVKDNTPEGQNADYREVTVNSIRNADMDAKTKNAMFDSYYSSKFTDAVNGMNLDDDMKLEVKFAKTLANGEKDENGKTISNSKAQAVADAYEDLGVLEDVLKYITDNEIDPSVMGLSKTVYNKLINGTGAGSSGRKTSSGGSGKSSSKKITGGSAGGITKAKGGGSLKKINGPSSMAPNPLRDTNIANNFFRAYANTFKRGSREVSSASGGQVVCPRCGNRVYSRSGRCPICGASL